MHEAAHAVLEMTRKEPDMASAVFAIQSASELLNSARMKLSHKSYQDAFRDSKSAIQMASSALLFRDGYIASTLEASVLYLTERYPGRLPVEEWHRLENILSGEGPGLLNLILRLTGKGRQTSEKEASHAVGIAQKFLDAAKAILELTL
jgi:HEPN domain-containing protein